MIFIKKQSYIMLFALLALLNNLSISMAKDEDKVIHNTELNGAIQDSRFKFPDAKLYAGQSLANICCHYILDNNIKIDPDLVNLNIQDRLAEIQQIKDTRMPKALKYALLNIIDDCSWNLISKSLVFINKINNYFDKQEADLILTGCLNYGSYLFEVNPWVYMVTGFVELMISNFLGDMNDCKLFIEDEIEEFKKLCLNLSDSDQDSILGDTLCGVLGLFDKNFSEDFFSKIINNGNENEFEYKLAMACREISKILIENVDVSSITKIKEAADDYHVFCALFIILYEHKELIKYFKEGELEKILERHENSIAHNKNNFIYFYYYPIIASAYFLIGQNDKAICILNSIIDNIKSACCDDDLFIFCLTQITTMFRDKLSDSDKAVILQKSLKIEEIMSRIRYKLKYRDDNYNSVITKRLWPYTDLE